MKSKDSTLSLKISPALKKRILHVSRETGIPMTTFVESAFLAVISFYEEHGHVPSPFSIVPKGGVAKVETRSGESSSSRI